MDHDKAEAEVARRSARIYLPLSLGAGASFFLAATLVGDHGWVARLGGTIWVTLLSLIVSMPMVISRVKKVTREEA